MIVDIISTDLQNLRKLIEYIILAFPGCIELIIHDDSTVMFEYKIWTTTRAKSPINDFISGAGLKNVN